MVLFDIIIILLILMSGIVGYKRGFLKELVMFAGTVLVCILAYNLKGPIADFLIMNGPMFTFIGRLSGIISLNILLYNIIAFVIVAVILFTVYGLILSMTGIIQKIVDSNFILAIPSKILGFVIGLIEGYFFMFIVLLILAMPLRGFDHFANSTVKDKMINDTPILSNAASSISNVVGDVYNITVDITEDKKDKKDINNEIMSTSIKNGLISLENAKKLNDKGRFDVFGGIDDAIKKNS